MDAEGLFGRASELLIAYKLPAFPRGGEDRRWQWRMSPDLYAVGKAAHGISTDPDLPPQLFGYWVEVDEARPPGSLILMPTP